jgi:CRP-like cAMP-binding protein
LLTLRRLHTPTQMPDRETRPATVISLTQNLSLVDAKYDKICLMSDGTFVEKGSYAELMAKKGMLWLLSNNQEGLQTVGGQASISAKRLHNMWPFFAVSSSSELATFQQLFSTVKLMEGEVLHSQGGECNAMFVLVEGSIDETLVDKSTHGKATKIKIWSMGDSTGEEALFNDKFRWRTTAIAKSTSLLLSLPRSLFTNALNLDPVIKSALEEGWTIIRQALAPSKLGFVWPFVGLPEKMLELIRKEFELEVLENDRDLFRQPEARCGALYVVIRGEMFLIQRKLDGHGTLSLLNSKVKEGGVIGEVIPCATNPDMLRRASHVPLRAKSLTRTMVGKLTPSKLQVSVARPSIGSFVACRCVPMQAGPRGSKQASKGSGVRRGRIANKLKRG